MTLIAEGTRIGDVVKSEYDHSRENILVDASQTLSIGEVVRRGAAGRMVALTAGVNEVQTVGITGTLTSGFWSLQFVDLNGAIKITDKIAHNASTANIQTAVDTALGGSMVVVAGTAITAMTFTFSGVGYAALPQTPVELDISDLVGEEDATVTITTAGGGGSGAAANEVQTIALDINGSAGTYVITVTDSAGTEVATSALAWDANTATIQTAIDTAAGGANQIVVGGADLNADITLTYSGTLYSARNQPAATLDISLLTGPTTYTNTQTTQGGPGGDAKASAICLQAVTTSGGETTTKTLFLVRDAKVIEQKLDYGGAVQQDVIADLETSGILVVDEV